MSKQPPAGVYKLLLLRLPPVKTLSIRKQFCLAYLKWKLTHKMEDKAAMVDLAKEFRKVEGRVGAHRTVIEKRARRYFKEVRKHRGLEASREAAREYAKGQRDRGEGIHTPEELELKKQRWKEVRRKQSKTRNEPNAKLWVVTDPDGNEFRVKSLTGWSNDNGLHYSTMHATANRPWEKPHYKGYKARHYDEMTDSHIPWAEGYEPKSWN